MKRWLELQTISAQKLITGSLQASQIISSANFVSGSTGWQIDGDGNAEFNDITVRGDIESGNWDGTSPANLATFDSGATVGFYLDSSVGSAQLMGDLFVGGDIELRSGGVFRTAASGDRIQTAAADPGNLQFHRSGGSEPGVVAIYNDGVANNHVLGIRSPAPQADEWAELRFFSEGDSGDRAKFLFTIGSAVNNWVMAFPASNGDAANPDLTWIDDLNTGIYRSAADVIGLASAGAEAARFSNVRSFLTGARNDTTASAANCLIQAADGRIFRSTSSLKYKPDWQHVNPADMELPMPITWTDERGQKRLGFGAEHVHEALPEAYEDGGENYDLRSIVAVLTAKVNRLEKEMV
jgi:hypothetical protein